MRASVIGLSRSATANAQPRLPGRVLERRRFEQDLRSSTEPRATRSASLGSRVASSTTAAATAASSGLLDERVTPISIGVDPAPAMIAASAQRRHPNIAFQLPHRSSRAPAGRRLGRRGAALRGAHLHTDRRRPARLISEVSRVLRPGGLLNISDLWLQIDTRNLDALRPRSREVRDLRGVRAPRGRRAAASGAAVVRDAHRCLRHRGDRAHGARNHERPSGRWFPMVRLASRERSSRRWSGMISSPSALPRRRFYGIPLVVDRWVLYGFSVAPFYSWGFFLPEMIKELGISRARSAAEVFGIYAFVGAGVAPLVGWTLGRFGIRWTMALGSVAGGDRLLARRPRRLADRALARVRVPRPRHPRVRDLLPVQTLASNWFLKHRALAMGVDPHRGRRHRSALAAARRLAARATTLAHGLDPDRGPVRRTRRDRGAPGARPSRGSRTVPGRRRVGGGGAPHRREAGRRRTAAAGPPPRRCGRRSST